ncbi:MAG: helix-turn-helix domain-containing protein [Treponema sp.]|jgi:transcriptional regulator with XRE-family HTH domain|nr:helix-turn-helix domain-containing protein [Treponema sp.]
MLDFEQLRQEIGTNIKIQRKNAHHTQQELAEKVEKTRFWLTAIETGINLPTIEGLYQLAEVFNCSVHDFLPKAIQKKTISFTGSVENVSSSSIEQVIFKLDRIQK